MPPGRKRGANKTKVNSELSLGDLVLAKVKGFPFWPAKISRPEDWDYAPDPRKYFVQFYGTKEIAFVGPAEIQEFTVEVKNKLSAKYDGKALKPFAQAVKEICEAFELSKERHPNKSRVGFIDSANVNKHFPVEELHSARSEHYLDVVDGPIEEALVDGQKGVESQNCIHREENPKSRNGKPVQSSFGNDSSHAKSEKRNTVADDSVHPSKIEVEFASNPVASLQNVSGIKDDENIGNCHKSNLIVTWRNQLTRGGHIPNERFVTSKRSDLNEETSNQSDGHSSKEYVGNSEFERNDCEKRKKIFKYATPCVVDRSTAIILNCGGQAKDVIYERGAQGCTAHWDHDDATCADGASNSITMSNNSYSVDDGTEISTSKAKNSAKADKLDDVQQSVSFTRNVFRQASRAYRGTVKICDANSESLLPLTKRRRRTLDAISDRLFESGNKTGKGLNFSRNDKKITANLLRTKRRVVYLDEDHEPKTPECGGSSSNYYMAINISDDILNAGRNKGNSGFAILGVDDVIKGDVTPSEECRPSFVGPCYPNLHHRMSDSILNIDGHKDSSSPGLLCAEDMVSGDVAFLEEQKPSLTSLGGSCSPNLHPQISDDILSADRNNDNSASGLLGTDIMINGDVSPAEKCRPSLTSLGGSCSSNLLQISGDIINADGTKDNSAFNASTHSVINGDAPSEECKPFLASLGGPCSANLHPSVQRPRNVNETIESLSPGKLEEEKLTLKKCEPSFTSLDGSGAHFHQDVGSPKKINEAIAYPSPGKSIEQKSILTPGSPTSFLPKRVLDDVEDIGREGSPLQECKPSIPSIGISHSPELYQAVQERPKKVCEGSTSPHQWKVEKTNAFSKPNRLPLMSPKTSPKAILSAKTVVQQSNTDKPFPKVSRSNVQRKATSGPSKTSAMLSDSSLNQAKMRSTKTNLNAVKSKSVLYTNAIGSAESPGKNILLLNERIENDRMISSTCSTSVDSAMSMKHLIAAAQAKRRQNQSKNCVSTCLPSTFSSSNDRCLGSSPNCAVQPFLLRNIINNLGDIDDPPSLSSPIPYGQAIVHNQFDNEVINERRCSGQNNAGVSLSDDTEAAVARDAFEGMVETLSRTKESIGRATRLAIDCAKYGIASEIVDLLAQTLESEVNVHRKVDLFFLVDSITQCSHSQKGVAGASYIPTVQAALPRLVRAAAPTGASARENRRQCLKVLRLWLERKIFPEYLLRRYIEDLAISNVDMSGAVHIKRLSRTERAVDDPIREMDGMLVDEYGSNTTFQLPGLLASRFYDEGDDVLPRKNDDVVLPSEPFHIGELWDTCELLSNDRPHCIVKDVDGELGVDDVSDHPKMQKFISSDNCLPVKADGCDGILASDFQIQADALPPPECSPPLPSESPPLTPPLPSSPPPLPPATPPLASSPPPPPPPPHPSQLPIFSSASLFQSQQYSFHSQPPPPPPLHPQISSLPQRHISQPSALPAQVTLLPSHLPLHISQPPSTPSQPPFPTCQIPLSLQSQNPPPMSTASLPSYPQPSPLPQLQHSQPLSVPNQHCNTRNQPSCFMPSGVSQLRESYAYGSSKELEYGSGDASVGPQSYRPNKHLEEARNTLVAQRPFHSAPALLGHCSNLSYSNPQHMQQSCNQTFSGCHLEGTPQYSAEEQRRSWTGLSVDDQQVNWMSRGNIPPGPPYVQEGYFCPGERRSNNLSFQQMVAVNLNPGHTGLQMFPSWSDTSTINSWRPA